MTCRRAQTEPSARADASLEDAPDAMLVRACLDGREDAWSELVRRHRRLVIAIPRRRGLDEASCQDVFQEVFAALLTALPNLRDRGSLAKWLITTAHRITARTVRASTGVHARPVVEIELDRPAAEEAVELEEKAIIHHALDRLEEPCRSLVVALFEAERDAYRRASTRLDMPIGSIGPRRARCLGRLIDIARRLGLEDLR